MRGGFLQSVLLLAGTTAVTQAQNDCLAGVKMPDVGQWAEYTGTMNKDPYTIRYAVVGAEERDGKAMKWLEMRMVGKKQDQNMVYQVLTPGSPVEIDQAEEVVLKAGDRQPVKMNGMMLKMILGQLKKHSILANLCEGITIAGEESVSVPAGTFKAVRYHDGRHDADTWVVPDRPFVMVKSKGKDFELSLASSGGDAKSSITETAQGTGPSK